MDATENNLNAIQSLIGQEQHRLSGILGRSRAYHAACDKLGPTLNPPMSGIELEKWVGAITAARARTFKASGNGNHELIQPQTVTTSSSGNGNGNGILSASVMDDDPDFGKVYRESMTTILAEKCRALKVGQVVAIVCADKRTAERYQQNVYHVAKHLGWAALPDGKRGYASKLHDNVLKIKRLA